MLFLKFADPPLSPVEFAIDKANDYVDMTRCGCPSCQTAISRIPEDSVLLARTVREAVRNHPATCFVAMCEGWSIEGFVRVINDLDRPATVKCREENGFKPAEWRPPEKKEG